MRRALRQFLVAVWKDWIALMSGLASVLLGVLAATRDSTLPPWTFWLTAVLCLLLCVFRVWWNEFDAREKTEAKLKELLESPNRKLARRHVRGLITELQAIADRIVRHDVSVENALVCLEGEIGSYVDQHYPEYSYDLRSDRDVPYKMADGLTDNERGLYRRVHILLTRLGEIAEAAMGKE